MKKQKWNGKEKANLLMRLSVLLKNGYSLAAALEMLILSNTSEEKKQRLQNVINDLRDGKSVHIAFEHLELPKDILAFLYFSEVYGELEKGFGQAGQLFLKREEMKEKLLKLLRYPLFLLWLVAVLAFIIARYLFPHFTEIYSSFSADLPLVTILFLQFLDLLPFLLMAVGVSFFIFFLYYWSIFRRRSPHQKVSFLLKIPVVSKMLQTLITYFFALQLSGLLQGGLKIFQSLSIFCEQDRLLFFKNEAAFLIGRLRQGEDFADVIRDRKHFLPELTNVIRHGQEQSELDKKLSTYSDLLYEQLEEKVKRAIMLVQPVIFFIVGMIVLTMFISIFLPMFDLIQAIQ